MDTFRFHPLVLYEQTEYIAATKFADRGDVQWKRGLTNGRARWCIKSLEAKGGVQVNPLEPLLPTACLS